MTPDLEKSIDAELGEKQGKDTYLRTLELSRAELRRGPRKNNALRKNGPKGTWLRKTVQRVHY